MERPSPVVVLLVLAVTAVPASAAAAAPPGATSSGAAPSSAAAPSSPVEVDTALSPPSPTTNTTARIVLPHYRVEQAAFETVTVGMAAALQSGADGARGEHRRVAIEREFEAADSVSEQRSVVDRALIRLEARSDALVERERAAIRAYADGNVTTEAMVRRLARIDARAREMEQTLSLVESLTRRIPTRDFQPRITAVRGEVEPLRGPVRNRVARSLAGERGSTRVHVVASETGVVLSTLADGQYVREATNWWHRNESGARALRTSIDTLNRAGELYPWVVSQRGSNSVDWRGNGIWRWEATHSQGRLVSYIDDSTRDAFRETQQLRVAEMPTTMVLASTGSGLRVELQRTYAGGPLRVLVEDAATDAVVNAAVTVDGHELGRIGADGLVVTLEPRPPYTVNVTGDDGSLTVRVERPLEEN